MCFKLHGLVASANYEVENFDGGKEIRTGRELMKSGLTVTLNERPAAAVIVYRSVSAAASSQNQLGKQSR